MGVFKEDKGKLIIDPEVKFIPEFKEILARDKDRRKRNAMNELAFIFYVIDYKSPYNIYSEDERIERSKKACKFEPAWKLDAKMKRAMKVYDELQMTPAIKSLQAIKESLFTALEAVKFVRSQLRTSIDYMNTVSDDDTEAPDSDQIIKTANELLKLADKIPTTISTLENVEDKVKLEQSTKRKIKGGGDTNFFED